MFYKQSLENLYTEILPIVQVVQEHLPKTKTSSYFYPKSLKRPEQMN